MSTSGRGTGTGGDLEFEQLLEGDMGSEASLSLGDRLKARVVRIGKDHVYLDVGTRADGLLALDGTAEQRGGPPPFKVGDVIDVSVMAFRDGAVICAQRLGAAPVAAHREKTDNRDAVRESLRAAFDAQMPVEGMVKEVCKGGFSVNVLGERAFCPISQIELRYCDAPEQHVGRTYAFQIVEYSGGPQGNLVVSRRRILEREAEEQAKELWARVDVGQTFEGTVTSIRAYGAFVDVGGIEGLLHVSELSYERVNDPKDVLQEGQRVQVSIKEVDRSKRRLSLSLKALMADPWAEISETIRKDGVYKGRVTRTAQFGAFVEIMPGIEGLVHISELADDRRVNTPREVVAPGDEVMVRVLEVDKDRRRISLSMKAEKAEDNWRDELAQAPSVSQGSKALGTLADLLSGSGTSKHREKNKRR